MLVLPLLPVIATTFSASERRYSRGDVLVADQRVGDANEREIRAALSLPIFFDHRAGRAAFRRLLDEFVAVEILAANRHEEIAGLNRARIGADSRDTIERRRFAGCDRSAGELGDVESGERIHYSEFHRTIFQRAARDLNVVERNGVIGEFLVGLVAFAGDEDDVARLRERDGARDRLARDR